LESASRQRLQLLRWVKPPADSDQGSLGIRQSPQQVERFFDGLALADLQRL
jgi:hypothetical protein